MVGQQHKLYIAIVAYIFKWKSQYMKIDMKNLKFVPVSEVPASHRRGETQWKTLFAQVPKGQAVVLQEPEVWASSISQALRRMQKRDGKFKNLQVITRGKHGTAMIYVVNTDKSTEPSMRK